MFKQNIRIYCLTLFFQFSRSVVSNSLRPHEPQHSRPPCPSPTPAVHPNTCPLSRWCHPTISSSVIPFSSCPQPFPASGSLQMSQLFALGGQSIGVSASTSVLQWTPRTGLLQDGLVGSPCSPGDSAFFIVQFSHPYVTTGKTIALTRQTFVGKVMSLLFNMLSRLVMTFLPRSKRLLISWLQSPSAVILEPRILNSVKLHFMPSVITVFKIMYMDDSDTSHIDFILINCVIQWSNTDTEGKG